MAAAEAVPVVAVAAMRETVEVMLRVMPVTLWAVVARERGVVMVASDAGAPTAEAVVVIGLADMRWVRCAREGGWSAKRTRI